MNDLYGRLKRAESDYQHARRQAREERDALDRAAWDLAAAQEAQRILQHAAQAVQQEAHQRISATVTRCLKAVFGPDAYTFRIRFDRKRGKTEAVLCLERGGEVLEDPVNELGGGVVDVVSFALRLAALLTGVPRRRRLLVLDEPAKHLSQEFRPAFRALLESLATELGVQILMTTHSRELVTGKVVQL